MMLSRLSRVAADELAARLVPNSRTRTDVMGAQGRVQRLLHSTRREATGDFLAVLPDLVEAISAGLVEPAKLTELSEAMPARWRATFLTSWGNSGNLVSALRTAGDEAKAGQWVRLTDASLGSRASYTTSGMLVSMGAEHLRKGRAQQLTSLTSTTRAPRNPHSGHRAAVPGTLTDAAAPKR